MMRSDSVTLRQFMLSSTDKSHDEQSVVDHHISFTFGFSIRFSYGFGTMTRYARRFMARIWNSGQ
jgi:hypothetical protein